MGYFKSSYHLIPNALWPGFCYSWSDFIQTVKGAVSGPEFQERKKCVDVLVPQSAALCQLGTTEGRGRMCAQN